MVELAKTHQQNTSEIMVLELVSTVFSAVTLMTTAFIYLELESLTLHSLANLTI